LILGETIRTLRRQGGLSQEKLAEKASLSPVFISQVECGKENISVDSAMRVARALGVCLRDLFRDT
jgi:transcriptional regulator with XRE-family HTH domain